MAKPVESQGAPLARVRLWDLPTRLFHWLLVLLIGLSWWSAEERVLTVHRISGYAILSLVLFRILWGLVGSASARFSNFVRGPRAVLSYARALWRGKSPPVVGHNPMGGLSVLAILVALLLQTGLGLFAVDIDGMESGPLSRLVSFETGRALAEGHEAVFNLLLVLVTLHLAAILFYLLVKRDNLITPMITGWKGVPQGPMSVRFAPLWRALLCALLAGGLVAGLVTGFWF